MAELPPEACMAKLNVVVAVAPFVKDMSRITTVYPLGAVNNVAQAESVFVRTNLVE